ncbi:MAG: hypothetical protein NXH85_03800 [Pseudomonadaceae bacterium]|nr:hypothetical protein [Pseudomonadaceae bacterium]
MSHDVDEASTDVDLSALVGADRDSSGVSAGSELIAFAEAALGDDATTIRAARDSVKEALGTAAMIDAAGIIANFQRMVRIADGTGIPLDPTVAAMTADLRAQLGINQYGSAGNTPTPTLIGRVLAKVAGPFLPRLLKARKRRPAS